MTCSANKRRSPRGLGISHNEAGRDTWRIRVEHRWIREVAASTPRRKSLPANRYQQKFRLLLSLDPDYHLSREKKWPSPTLASIPRSSLKQRDVNREIIESYIRCNKVQLIKELIRELIDFINILKFFIIRLSNLPANIFFDEIMTFKIYLQFY